MTDTRTFHLGDILTVTTGRLLCPTGVGGLYKILNWMTGESLMTHQLMRAADECQAPLLAQHPGLADIVVPEDLEGWDPVHAWLVEATAKHGEHFEVAPLQAADHTRIDPLTELRMLNPNIPVVAVAQETE